MSEPRPQRRSPDPSVIVGRIVGGVILYGGIGYALDRWWETSFMVAIGIIVGAGLGIYMVLASLRISSDS